MIVGPDRARTLSETGATLRLALPLIAGQLSAVGSSAVDALFAGHYSAHVLAAVAVGASLWSLAIVTAIGVLMALPASVAHLDGAGRRAEIGPLFRQALWLAAMLGVTLLLMVRFGAPLLMRRIGVDPRLWTDVTAFLHAVSWGAPALVLYFSLRGLSEGLSLTRPTMYFGFLGLLVLAPLDYVLIYGRFGLPALGARGSGIATASALWLQLGAFATYLRWSRHYRDLHLAARLDRPDPRAIGALLRLGVPMGVSLLMEAGLFVAAALLIARLGQDAVAGHQIALNVATVAFMVPLGLAMAITVRVGHAAGRGDARGVRYAGYCGVALTLLTQSVSTTLMLTLPHAIAALYTGDARVIAMAAPLLVLAGLFQFADGIQVASNGALRGLKDTRVPMLITSISYWGIGMPVGAWLAFGRGLGARGIWMGLIAGLSAAALLLFTRFARLARRSRQA